MLVDLHAHFPMHLLPGDQRQSHDHVRACSRQRWQARIVDLIDFKPFATRPSTGNRSHADHCPSSGPLAKRRSTDIGGTE